DDHFTAVDVHDPAKPVILGTWRVCTSDGAALGGCSIIRVVFRDERIVAIGDTATNISLFDITRPDRTNPTAVTPIHGGSVGALSLLQLGKDRSVLAVTGLNTTVVELWDISNEG